MAVSLEKIVAQLPEKRQKKIEARVNELVAIEIYLQEVRKLKK